MNACRLIKKEFKFLKKYGFKQEVYSKNTDYEIILSRDNLKIEINYYLGCLTDKISNINDLFSNTKFIINIAISHNRIKENIFNCSLFDKLILEKLEAEIKMIDINNVEQILRTYSCFIRNHIEVFVS